MDPEAAKRNAAAAAAALVESGMTVGLGTGSTAKWAVEAIGGRLEAGEIGGIVGIPTSEATAAQAQGLGIPLADLRERTEVDLAIDGADEVAPDLSLTKGWGGALVREKLVAAVARRFAVIVDEGKLVERLGTRGPVPVEVVPFAWRHQAAWLERETGAEAALRGGPDDPFVTDNGNLILDCAFTRGLDDPTSFSSALAGRTGIVGHGLFLGMATEAFVGTFDGVRRIAPAN